MESIEIWFLGMHTMGRDREAKISLSLDFPAHPLLSTLLYTGSSFILLGTLGPGSPRENVQALGPYPLIESSQPAFRVSLIFFI